MQIEFEFSGGYGGVFAKNPLVYRANTGDLPEAEREALLELVRASGVLELEEPEAGPSRGRDVFDYRLSIRDGELRRSLRFDDASAPAAARPLLAHLRKLALEKRASAGTART